MINEKARRQKHVRNERIRNNESAGGMKKKHEVVADRSWTWNWK